MANSNIENSGPGQDATPRYHYLSNTLPISIPFLFPPPNPLLLLFLVVLLLVLLPILMRLMFFPPLVPPRHLCSVNARHVIRASLPERWMNSQTSRRLSAMIPYSRVFCRTTILLQPCILCSEVGSATCLPLALTP